VSDILNAVLVTHSELTLIVLKVVLVVLVMMHIAVFLTWADRRQGAMIQDRIGPNRAVIWLPTPMAQGMAVAPARRRGTRYLARSSRSGGCRAHHLGHTRSASWRYFSLGSPGVVIAGASPSAGRAIA
jgi:hypothetical protein